MSCDLGGIETLRREIDTELEALVLFAQYGYEEKKLFHTESFSVMDTRGSAIGDEGFQHYMGYVLDREEYVQYAETIRNTPPPRDDSFHMIKGVDEGGGQLGYVYHSLDNKVEAFIRCLGFKRGIRRTGTPPPLVSEDVVDPFANDLETPHVDMRWNPSTFFRLYAYFAFYRWCHYNLFFRYRRRTDALILNDMETYYKPMFTIGRLYSLHVHSKLPGSTLTRTLHPLEFLLHLFFKSARLTAMFPYYDLDLPRDPSYSPEYHERTVRRRRVMLEKIGHYLTEGNETELQKEFRESMPRLVRETFGDRFIRGDGGAFAIWNVYEGFSYSRFGRHKPIRKSRKNSNSKSKSNKLGRPAKRRGRRSSS